MHRGERLEELLEQRRGISHRQGAVLVEQVLHRPAADQVHGEDDQVVVGGPADGRDDVGVAHPHRLLTHEPDRRAALCWPSTLTATTSPERSSRARQTEPMPPAPIWSSIA